MLKVISIIGAVMGGAVFATICIVAAIATWLTALFCGLALIYAAINGLGYAGTHHLAQWHRMMGNLETAGLCGLVVLTIRYLPVILTDPVRRSYRFR